MVALSNVWNLSPAHADTTLHQHHMTVRPDCGAQTNHNHLGSSPVTCLTSMYEKVLLYCRINKMCNSGANWFSWINCLQLRQLDDVRPEKKEFRPNGTFQGFTSGNFFISSKSWKNLTWIFPSWSFSFLSLSVFIIFFFTSHFVVFLSYQTNILWLTSSWRQKLCVLKKGSDFSNVDYLILGPPTRFVIFCFFSLSLEGRLSSELQLHRHRVMWPDRQALGHKYRQLGSVFHGT